MPLVVVTQRAVFGLERCRLFLQEKDRSAASRAGQVIAKQLTLLESVPELGRPLDEEPELRELIIPFGDSGYVALYRHDSQLDTIYVLAFRHQKEAGLA
mgnify:CR=1 FL=1